MVALMVVMVVVAMVMLVAVAVGIVVVAVVVRPVGEVISLYGDVEVFLHVARVGHHSLGGEEVRG